MVVGMIGVPLCRAWFDAYSHGERVPLWSAGLDLGSSAIPCCAELTAGWLRGGEVALECCRRIVG